MQKSSFRYNTEQLVVSWYSIQVMDNIQETAIVYQNDENLRWNYQHMPINQSKMELPTHTY